MPIKMAQNRSWYTSEGSIVGYLANDGKWFYKIGDELIGYRDGKWIYTPAGVIIGWVDDQDKWIYSQSGETLGYLQP